MHKYVAKIMVENPDVPRDERFREFTVVCDGETPTQAWEAFLQGGCDECGEDIRNYIRLIEIKKL